MHRMAAKAVQMFIRSCYYLSCEVCGVDAWFCKEMHDHCTKLVCPSDSWRSCVVVTLANALPQVP